MLRVLLTLLLAGVGVSAVVPREDPPVATRPAGGDVAGRITPAPKIAEIYAVSRATKKRFKPDKFDKKTGKFRFKNLPGDATYDVGIVTNDGARIEGIDLSWHEARMLRLAAIRRKQLKLPPERKRKFTVADAAGLLKYVRDLKDFCDVRRALYVKGAGLRATMLVEVMRIRPFHAQRGDEVIWRTELWYFRYRYGGWERVANVGRVLQRRRIQVSEWKAITMVYYPTMSAYIDQNGKSEPIKFTIPEKIDPARGRLAGTNPVQKTKPIIIGVKGDKKKTGPVKATTQSSQPSGISIE